MPCIEPQRDALPLFQLLQERYAAALSRDSSLRSVSWFIVKRATDFGASCMDTDAYRCDHPQYLAVIGQKFYGLQPPRTGLSSLLEMFSGGLQ